MRAKTAVELLSELSTAVGYVVDIQSNGDVWTVQPGYKPGVSPDAESVPMTESDIARAQAALDDIPKAISTINPAMAFAAFQSSPNAPLRQSIWDAGVGRLLMWFFIEKPNELQIVEKMVQDGDAFHAGFPEFTFASFVGVINNAAAAEPPQES